jgi:hypothetical protein
MASSSRKPVAVTEKEYFASGDWKCSGSPTGAHWWNCNADPNVCKICGKVKSLAPPASTLLP